MEPALVDDIVLGVVSPVGEQGAVIARTAALAAGLPETVAGVQINRFCASGLEAINLAAQKVRSGFEDLVLADGVESMSHVPMGSTAVPGRWTPRPRRRPASCPRALVPTHRHPRRLGPRGRRRLCRRVPRPRRQGLVQREMNEAFAAVVLRFMKDTGFDHEQVNVNGGAIAMGHPLGATGAMILGSLVDELERRDLRYGLATLCVGGGMGIATVVERV
jgi:acetyl-CoA acetyltransferase